MIISSAHNVLIYEHTRRVAPELDAPAVKCTLRPPAPLRVDVMDADTLDAALLHLRDRPLVMNLADDVRPGGYVDVGACSQEECLFRRTNLCKSLDPALYPIRPDEAVYSPSIVVFKRGEHELYQPLDEAFRVDVVSCPGLKYPPLAEGRLRPEDVEVLKNKVRLILQVCETYGHPTLIAGALGCGAWCNPPEDVARAFKAVFEEQPRTVVRRVVFAILKPKGIFNPNLANANFEVFRRVFGLTPSEPSAA